MSDLLIFPNQLFEKILDMGSDFDEVFLVEHPRFFTDYNFNKKKLILHRASMQYFLKKLDKIYDTNYICYDEDFSSYLSDNDFKLFDPIDHKLKTDLNSLENDLGISFEFLDSPGFVSDMEWNKSVLENVGFRHLEYYKEQRRRLDVLMDGDDPVGGKWSFDPENREKMPVDEEPPEIPDFSNGYVEEAKDYVEENFGENPGNLHNFVFPVTHGDAELLLDDFLRNRLDKFGPFQDAIDEDLKFGYHSLLSSSLNSGLITPMEVVDRTLDYYQDNEGGLEVRSVEGFIRQIIGWREYVRALYEFKEEKMRNSNFWDHNNSLPDGLYDASTGIKPLDVSIGNALSNGYCHHIERLMVLGNFLLLSEVDPDEVYDWFMEMFVDAYDWVMVPNIYGMSQYAWTEMMTKPYISSSNYIKKMSHYEEGDWCDVWDGLYWRFIKKNKEKIENIPRMKIMTYQVSRMNDEALEDHLENAEEFLEDNVR